jgi:hypothetical protein
MKPMTKGIRTLRNTQSKQKIMSSPRKKTRSCQCLLSSAPNALRFNLHSHYHLKETGESPGTMMISITSYRISIHTFFYIVRHHVKSDMAVPYKMAIIN